MIRVPPTALTLDTEYISQSQTWYAVAMRGRHWREWYERDGLRPTVYQGHIVVGWQRLVELAIELEIPEIEVREYGVDA